MKICSLLNTIDSKSSRGEKHTNQDTEDNIPNSVYEDMDLSCAQLTLSVLKTALKQTAEAKSP